MISHINKKTYRIDGVDFTMNPMSTFRHRTKDRNITYGEYYNKHYSVDVRNKSQPMLVLPPVSP